MPCFGVDVHPQFQAGLNIEALPAAGIDFLSTKLSEGTSASWTDGIKLPNGQVSSSTDWIRRARNAGLLVMGYHYLRPGNIDKQAQIFCDALRRCGNIPGVVDAEALDSAGKATLAATDIRNFVAACRGLGANIPLLYLPRWYWERIGSPSLVGLPALWASSYPSTGIDTVANIFKLVSSSRWTNYGGGAVHVLQFTETAVVAGKSPVDANAFQGSKSELANLLGIASRKDHTEMIQLPATEMPKDLASAPKNWLQRNFDIPWNITGGWEGQAAFSFGVQDWPGRTVDVARGLLLIASWILPGGRLIPVNAGLTAAGGGLILGPHLLTPEYLAPAGCEGVTLNYAAPGGAYVAIGRSS